MKKGVKIWLGIALFLFVTVIALGMYKFNYLSGKDGYDVDGNKISITSQEKNKFKEIDKEVAFKGFELYSWKENNEWNFSLLKGTNRLKTCDEVLEGKVSGIKEGKKLIKNIKEDQLFTILDRIDNCKTFQEAPDELYEY